MCLFSFFKTRRKWPKGLSAKTRRASRLVKILKPLFYLRTRNSCHHPPSCLRQPSNEQEGSALIKNTLAVNASAGANKLRILRCRCSIDEAAGAQ